MAAFSIHQQVTFSIADGGIYRFLSQLIHNWKPWTKNTGPRLAAGKLIVSRNAYKGGVKPMLRDMSALLREQKEQLKRFD
jgi:hypothetical protein